ncbi:MAG: hypothetical protein AB1486_18785 [Planctomycetota bacterium]
MTHERFDFPDANSLCGKARSLGLELPFSHDVGALFTPLEVAGRRVANRLAIQPMEASDGDATGAPGELTARRYRRFASGGSAVIWFEATAVVPEGRSNPRQLALTKATLDPLKRLVEATRRAAQPAGTGDPRHVLFILQLTHAGRYSRPGGSPRPILAQHNAILDPLMGIPSDYPLVSDGELDRLQDEFVRAARMAQEAGFDGVDVKACHGYLVSELLAAFTREESRYGGPFENRIRFLREAVARIRCEVPGIIVASRINALDGIPYPHGFGGRRDEPGIVDLAEAVALVRLLRDSGVAIVNVSAGIPTFNAHWGRPFNQPLAGAPLPDEHPLTGVARLLHLTATLQRSLPDLPMVGTGYSWLRHYFPNVAAAVVASGGAAFAGVGRLAFAYPNYAWDLARGGALDPHKCCTGCSRCSQIMRDGGFAGCAVRDTEIYGPQYREGRRRVGSGAR